ncbi:MAG: hypothetical protein U0T81_18460 [Saprospiraceae bacterium]
MTATVHDPDMLHKLISLFGHEKICLGSDYPFPLGEPSTKSYSIHELDWRVTIVVELRICRNLVGNVQRMKVRY